MTARRLDGAALPRSLKLGLAAIALLFAAAWVRHHGYLGADWLRSGLRGPGFSLRYVDILGARALDRGELCRLAGVRAGTPLVDLDPERAAEALAAHPRVAKVRAMRLPPDRLVVSLVERVPVALQAESGLALDASGERFPPLSDEVARLPLLSGDPRAALPVIAAARKAGLNLASVDARGRGEVRVRTLGRAVQLVVGRDPVAAFADWRQLADSEVVESEGAREVDLRFRSNPVLRDFKRTTGVMRMAKHDELIVGLDVGTTKICAVVAEPAGDSIEVIGIGTHPSRGLRKGVVVDIDATVDSIRKAVDEAEMMAGCEISSVYAGIAGGHIQAHNEIGMIAIKDREVRHADLKRVIEQAQAIAIPADREVIHVIPQEYELDGQDGIKQPVGMSGVRLIAKVHIVTAAVTSAQNVIKSANKAGLNVIDIVLEPLASAEATLAPDEKELGVALIDLGGTTDLAVFGDGSIKHTAVLSLGGYHLTNDAAVGLRTPFDQAERIKRRFGCAAARYLPREELLTVPSVGGRAPREVSRKMLSEFLEPRMEEILSLVREELARTGHLDKIPSGIVVTGGTSALEGLPELAEEIFELPVRRGTPRGIGGLVDRVAGPEFATAVGLALYGSKRQGKPRFRVYDGSSFRKVRSRMREWFYGEMR